MLPEPAAPEIEAEGPRKRRRWRLWTFVIVNVLGLLLLIPLLSVTLPLVKIWWRTRSQASLRLHEEEIKHMEPGAPGASEQAAISSQRRPEDTTALSSLTNQLGALETLSDRDLQRIVAQQFGTAARSASSATNFDVESAVFDSISRTTLVYRGHTYYGYQVSLIDQNGLHKTNLDCFAEPNLEYERSMATLDLINKSPQLKRIYQAMGPKLAELSASGTNAPDTSSDNPVLRLNPDAPAGAGPEK